MDFNVILAELNIHEKACETKWRQKFLAFKLLTRLIKTQCHHHHHHHWSHNNRKKTN